MGESAEGNIAAVICWGIREADGVKWMQVEIFFRCNEGRVRSEEAYPKKKRLIAMLFQESDGLGGDHAIGLFLVGPIGSQPAERGADGFLRCGIDDEFFVGDITAFRIHDKLPRECVVEAIGADAVGHVVMVDFADAGGEPAVLTKELRQCDHTWQGFAEMTVKVINLRGIGPAAGKHAGAARIAQRDLIVGAFKLHAACCESVDVRRVCAVVREIVDGNEKHIWLCSQEGHAG